MCACVCDIYIYRERERGRVRVCVCFVCVYLRTCIYYVMINCSWGVRRNQEGLSYEVENRAESLTRGDKEITQYEVIGVKGNIVWILYPWMVLDDGSSVDRSRIIMSPSVERGLNPHLLHLLDGLPFMSLLPLYTR